MCFIHYSIIRIFCRWAAARRRSANAIHGHFNEGIPQSTMDNINILYYTNTSTNGNYDENKPVLHFMFEDRSSASSHLSNTVTEYVAFWNECGDRVWSKYCIGGEFQSTSVACCVRRLMWVVTVTMVWFITGLTSFDFGLFEALENFYSGNFAFFCDDVLKRIPLNFWTTTKRL